MENTVALIASVEPNHSLFPSLSLGTRLWGLALCSGICALFYLSAFLGIFQLPLNPKPFVLSYSIANISGLIATIFVISPSRQLRMMCSKSRWPSSTLYIASLATTVTLCMIKASAVLIIIAVGLQVVATIWYILSYVPFAQRLASQIFGMCTNIGVAT